MTHLIPLKTELPDGVLRQHTIVLGKTGAGKSSVMRGMVEQLLHDNKPVCIVDPKGDWWGLKSSADGKHPGFPIVIFGGDHADVPLNVHAGAHVAELVATGNRPCIIDLGGWSVADRTRFFVDFAGALFRHSRGPRWLVIDEVHNFAPQQPIQKNPDHMKMLHWANRLASEGRGKGIQLIAASQRPQKVHKDFVTSCETLVAMRVIHPLDRKAIKDWIDGCPDQVKGKEVLDTLASMPRGTGWAWSPEIGFGPKKIAFPMFVTYDSFAAPTGEKAERLKGWAEVDLNEVKAKLDDVVKEAKANDPAELKRELSVAKAQLVDMGRKLAALQQASKVEAKPEVDRLLIQRLEQRATLIGRRDVCKALLGPLQAVGRGLEAILNTVEAGADVEVPPREDVLSTTGKPVVNNTIARPVPHSPGANWKPVVEQRHAEMAPSGNGTVSGPERRILDALVDLHAIGVDQPEREQVAFLAGYTNLRSKGFANAMGALNSAGHISYPAQGSVRIEPSGRALAKPQPELLTNGALQERICTLLGGASSRILRPLIETYPQAIERDELGRQAGYDNVRSKGFANAIGRLRTLGFVSYPERGTVRAHSVLFPAGAP